MKHQDWIDCINGNLLAFLISSAYLGMFVCSPPAAESPTNCRPPETWQKGRLVGIEAVGLINGQREKVRLVFESGFAQKQQGLVAGTMHPLCTAWYLSGTGWGVRKEIQERLSL